jgi:hypothetical protein
MEKYFLIQGILAKTLILRAVTTVYVVLRDRKMAVDAINNDENS